MGAVKKARRARQRRAGEQLARLCRCPKGPTISGDGDLGRAFCNCTRCNEIVKLERFYELLRKRYG